MNKRQDNHTDRHVKITFYFIGFEDRHIDRQTYIQKDRQTYIQKDRQTYIHINIKTYIHTDRQTDRLKKRHTDRPILFFFTM